ncbi:MAG TPA: Trm112 family protein [Actinomycetota bacterium]|nr:Trm112 family protein [Actinomycetota bacterium]
MPIDRELLEILACPKCKHPVTEETKDGEEFLVCTAPDCRLAYPVRDGIPVMLIDEARPWSD